jgi:DNA-directed RNA polymerase subunit RPC12/RpoP
MNDYDLILIPNPKDSRSILLTAEGSFCGAGPNRLFCGRCGQVLVNGASDNQFRDLVFKCWRCSHFNSVDVLISRIQPRAIVQAEPGSPVDQTRYAFHERAVQCTRCSHPNIFIKIGDNRPIMHTNGYEQCNLVMEAIDAENFTWIVRCSKCGNEDACVVPMPFRQKR